LSRASTTRPRGLSTDQRFSAGRSTTRPTALNGDLNDYLNSITAKTKNDSSSDTQYLEQVASLLLGTTSMGYPAPVVDPGESVWSRIRSRTTAVPGQLVVA
jgi:hypothetical protein